MSDKYNIERGLISKLLETKDLVQVQDNQIKPFFLTGENRKAYKYILNFYKETGEVPTVRAFSLKFPDYELETYINDKATETYGTEESLKYWCNELRKKTKHNKLVDSVEAITDSLEELDTDKAYSLMKKTVLYVENEIVETNAVDITKDPESRVRAYLDRVKNKGMLGISTGFDKLDFIIKGLQDKQLITILAQTGIGKTWFEILLGSYAQLNGHRVLHITTEMSEEQMRDRYDAILMGRIRGEFNYSRFKSGLLSPEEQNNYFQFLKEDLPKLEPLVIDSVDGVTSLGAKIDQYDPDLILVDGAYLLEDDRGAKDDWLRIAHITRDIKALAKQKKKPIVINTQADSNTSVKKGPELGNIGYSKAIGQDSDVVLALFRDELMIEDREMDIKVLKQREGTLGKVRCNWDFSTMNFDPIYSEAQGNMSFEKNPIEPGEMHIPVSEEEV